MKRSSSELKSLAKGKLIGNYAIPMGAMVLVILISIVVTLFTSYTFIRTASMSGLVIYYVSSLIISILLSILSVGICSLFLNLCRNREYKISDILYGFRNNPDHVIGLIALMYVMVFVCYLPYIVLGVCYTIFPSFIAVKLLSILFWILGTVLVVYLLLTYSQVIYLYIDNPHQKILTIFKESKELMRGNKGRLFYLFVSFIGLFLLSLFSCYIGLLWIGPYCSATTTHFYMELRKEL